MEGLRTRVRFPPAPPTNKNATRGWRFYCLLKTVYRTRGTRGELGFRVARNEPANDSAHAGALAGEDGRFPPAPPTNKNATLGWRFYLFIKN